MNFKELLNDVDHLFLRINILELSVKNKKLEKRIDYISSFIDYYMGIKEEISNDARYKKDIFESECDSISYKIGLYIRSLTDFRNKIYINRSEIEEVPDSFISIFNELKEQSREIFKYTQEVFGIKDE